MTELDAIRRDIARLSTDLSRGVAATSVLLDQLQRQQSELSRKIEEKVHRDHESDLKLAAELAEVKTKLRVLDQLADLPERLAKLEGLHEQVKADATGKHEIAKKAIESGEKKEDRKLEEKKIRADQRKATLQFWGAVLVVGLPGVLALLWNLLGLPGEPPMPHAEPPASHSSAPP